MDLITCDQEISLSGCSRESLSREKKNILDSQITDLKFPIILLFPFVSFYTPDIFEGISKSKYFIKLLSILFTIVASFTK